jgi:hypothetical protein
MVLYQWPWTLTRLRRPQTPGGRIRALGFASTRTRGRRRGPRTGDVSVSGLAGLIWPWTLTRLRRPQTPGGRIRALGFAPWGARRRSPPDTNGTDHCLGPLVLGRAGSPKTKGSS